MADQKAKEMEPVETQTVEIMPPDIEKNQHKLIIHLRLLKIINDTASRNNSSVVSNV